MEFADALTIASITLNKLQEEVEAIKATGSEAEVQRAMATFNGAGVLGHALMAAHQAQLSRAYGIAQSADVTYRCVSCGEDFVATAEADATGSFATDQIQPRCIHDDCPSLR
ncbi:hypothetical protein AB0G83_07410 [Streptomyces klenkii]|uniref:hypothetical protein n=1 Tax=Streptomyces klenkii TaxID=1420899 RepID=UPI0033CF9065